LPAGVCLLWNTRRLNMCAYTQTVREIALEQPASIRVFEHFGIDYCCGGRKPLEEACTGAHLEVETVIAALEAAARVPAATTEDWTSKPLAELCSHIVTTHHEYVKRELPRLAQLAEKVVNRHGSTMPELPTIASSLAKLSEELTQHLAKEELVLFPYVAGLEQALCDGSPLPRSCFGNVANPIAMMTQEHDAAGSLLAELRRLSGNFTTPPGACPTFIAFYEGLKEFEGDLHQHIHLENNVLFPRAIELENR
jgi:regulator of cell morphogenesis and NO signaling